MKRFLYDFTYMNGLRDWTEEDMAMNYISDDVIEGMSSGQTVDEIRRNNTPLHNKIILRGPLYRIENGKLITYTENEIISILMKMKDSHRVQKYLSDTANDSDSDSGIDMYQTDSFFVLRKPIEA